jgi:hypothetical protein
VGLYELCRIRDKRKQIHFLSLRQDCFCHTGGKVSAPMWTNILQDMPTELLT